MFEETSLVEELFLLFFFNPTSRNVCGQETSIDALKPSEIILNFECAMDMEALEIEARCQIIFNPLKTKQNEKKNGKSSCNKCLSNVNREKNYIFS